MVLGRTSIEGMRVCTQSGLQDHTPFMPDVAYHPAVLPPPKKAS